MRIRLASSRLPRRAPVAALALAAVLLALLATAAPAAAQSVAAGVHAGTSGIGPDLTFRLNDHAHVRLTGGAASYDTEIETDDLVYDAEADLRTGFVLLDWYPGAGGFRVSLGGGWNGTEAEVSAPVVRLVAQFIDLDSLALLPPLGDVTGTAQGDDFVPAVMIGWGNPFRGGAWNVSFEIGAFYQGEPEVDLTYQPPPGFADLPITIPEGFLDAALVAEEADLERELEDYTLVPVVSLGVGYRF
jgi:hypothetical protein